MRWLPPKRYGLSPWLYLAYLGFLFIHHLGRPQFRPDLLTGDLLVVALFLPAYFASWQLHWRWQPLLGALMLGPGLWAAQWNPGAAALAIYCAALGGFYPDSRHGLLHLGGTLLMLAAGAWLLQLSHWFWLPATGMSAIIGLLNILHSERERSREQLLRKQEEVEYFATRAERERIARDLHDLLGHTLSVITLKAELAGKLIGRDNARAGDEIRDIEHTAREALAQVREAVQGYRHSDLAQELDRLHSALDVAGVRCDSDNRLDDVPPAISNVLSLALREAITNVIRHAQATQCTIRLQEQDGIIELSVRDNGSAPITASQHDEGNGLRGMRERAAILGGELLFSSGDGHLLCMRLPRRTAS